jgi:hypothetical protein
MTSAAAIRPFTASDVESVARLFLRVFKRRDGAPPSQVLRDTFRQSFIPADGQPASLVHIRGDGTLDGFVGVLDQAFQCGEERLRVAVVGSLMVADPTQDPLAGARLLRAVANGPYDAVLSETANPLSERMWDKLGGHAITGYSTDFVRILRPAGFAAALACHQCGWLAPLVYPAALIDLLARRAFRPPAPAHGTTQTAAGTGRMASTLHAYAQGFALHPAFSQAEWEQRIRAAIPKPAYGGCVANLVHDRQGNVTGAYIYHGKPDAIGHVLHLQAHPKHTGTIIAHMLADALERGVTALRGRATPTTAHALVLQGAGLVHRSSFTVHTRNASLREALETGNAFVTGLAGETWMPLIGGKF